jgi:sigma-B regulation protein RsbU (phosphoserine phosphatase)
MEQETPSTEHSITVLLVDDQAMIGEAVRRMLAGQKDIDFHFCSDSTKAMETALRVQPTVILQDLVMPDVDGLTLVRQFRANESTKDIPMIVLSTKEEPVIKAEAFALGANDYLVKLPDKIELIARIRYHSRGYINLLERNEAYQALFRSQQRLAKELAEAAEYVKSLLPERLDEKIWTDWMFVPSTQLGGDSFGYHWLDENHFALYLLDVCGHGVGAALLSVSVLNVLRSQSLPDTDFRDPAQVLAGLNDAFPMEQNNRMYFTMWYGVFDRLSRTIIYSSGGHPPAVLLNGPDRNTAKLEQLSTPCLVVGALKGIQYKSVTQSLDDYAEMFLYSDGVYEVNRPDGSMLERDEFIEKLIETPSDQSPLTFIYRYVCDLQNSEQFEDDYSILQVRFL